MGLDLVTFGETLVRLSPPSPKTIEQAIALDMNVAGSELNAAVAASRLGLKTSYVTVLAKNPLGRFVANKCLEQGVDTNWIQWSTEYRQGLYFFEHGSPPRPSMAYYDRNPSAFSNIAEEDFHWNEILADTKVFLTSGINSALGENVHAVTLQAVQTAKQLGKLVAFDINHRNNLWSHKEAAFILQDFLPYVDILFTSGSDACNILGFEEKPNKVVAQEISQKFEINTVCLIHGPVGDSLWEAVCVSNGKVYSERQTGELVTVDRLGVGDAFAGGFLTGLLKEGPELGLKIGNAMMMMKNSMQGDFCFVTEELMEHFLSGKQEILKR